MAGSAGGERLMVLLQLSEAFLRTTTEKSLGLWTKPLLDE